MAGDADKISTEASVWLARLERGLLPQEGTTLRDWLHQPAHRSAIVDAAKLWHGPDIIAVLAELVPVGFGTLPPPKAKRRLRPANILIALCGALAAIAPLVYVQHNMAHRRGPWGESVYTTKPGETRTVALHDGSTVTLNGHSQLGILFGAGSRLAVLDYGEAIFHTTPERRPFELNAGGRHLLATPSTFDVRVVGAHALELTVLEGAVVIHALSWRWPATPAQARLFDPKAFVDSTVGPLQAASVEDAALIRYPLTAPAVEARLRWQPEQVVYVTP